LEQLIDYIGRIFLEDPAGHCFRWLDIKVNGGSSCIAPGKL